MENKKKNIFGKYQCACCGFFTIIEIKETCPVCFWEEDLFQEENIDDDGGPNNISLRKAKENFEIYGVSEMSFKKFVRSPQEDENG